jgi:peptidoglycan hydrolase CwlO-like protein
MVSSFWAIWLSISFWSRVIEQLTDILSQKDKELENFHKQVAALESERNDLQGKHDKLTETCDQRNEQLNTQTTQLQQANDALSQATSNIESKQGV